MTIATKAREAAPTKMRVISRVSRLSSHGKATQYGIEDFQQLLFALEALELAGACEGRLSGVGNDRFLSRVTDD